MSPSSLPAGLDPAGKGLTQALALARIAQDGFNELPKARRRSLSRIAVDVLRQPMLALLIIGGTVYLLLGDRAEAVILLAFACLSVTITVVQEARTERVLDALRDLTSPRALVIRDGQRVRIAGRDVARGDLMVLSEGDRVPADAVLLEAINLAADESLLTGEAVAVRKTARSEPDQTDPGGNDQSVVYSGSLIVGGSAIAQVTATGICSKIGQIGASLDQLEFETPHLQQQMHRLVVVFGAAGAAVSGAVIVLYILLRGDWLQGVLAGIALGMSMLPEEFPMVLAVFMAMGAWRISQARVLTRRASAIETLGAASVLCTDKTGTLTENRMTITELRLPEGSTTIIGPVLSEAFRDLVTAGVMASAIHPFDPMDKAFHALAVSAGGPGQLMPDANRTLTRIYPLTPDLLAMSQVWTAPEGGWQIAAKGAPEAIVRLCRLQADARDALMAQVDLMAQTGLRVLAIAEAKYAGNDLPTSQTDLGFTLLGLVGLSDPLRASVPAAIAQCRNAGIRVIMITGDHPSTAQTIAAQAGLHGDRVLTGQALAKMSDADLVDALREVTVFARIAPQQKLRIVTALKTSGAIVAMTGDGVNDAPSLKAAHIGVAMGGRGTDVAREAASIVLLDDDFGSIVTTVRLGRRIYDNLRKAMSFILAVHVPIAGLALMPLLFGMPILFGPMHIAFLEMVIDPVCALVFEAETEEDGIMSRPPRPPEEPLFSGLTILWSLVQGALVLVVTATILFLGPVHGLSAEQVRTATFSALVFSIMALIFVDRSVSASVVTALRRTNWALAIVLPVVVALLAVTAFWHPARTLFGFAALDPWVLVIPPLAGSSILLALEALKPIWRKIIVVRHKPKEPVF